MIIKNNGTYTINIGVDSYVTSFSTQIRNKYFSILRNMVNSYVEANERTVLTLNKL